MKLFGFCFTWAHGIGFGGVILGLIDILSSEYVQGLIHILPPKSAAVAGAVFTLAAALKLVFTSKAKKV